MIDWWQGLAADDKATWLAVLFAGGGFLFTAWTLSRNEMDRRRRERREESAQARSVKVSQVIQGSNSGITEKALTMGLIVTVTNDSDDVIHDVKILLSVEPRDAAEEGAHVEQTWILFAAGHQESVSLTPRIPVVPGTHSPLKDFVAAPVVEFTDIEGRRWRRDRDYRLARIK